MEKLTLRLAMSENLFRACLDVEVLQPSMLGPPYKYIPFFEKPEDAVAKAVDANQAWQPSWKVLVMTLTADQAWQLFKAGILWRYKTDSWRLYAAVPLNGSLPIEGWLEDWKVTCCNPLGENMWPQGALSRHEVGANANYGKTLYDDPDALIRALADSHHGTMVAYVACAKDMESKILQTGVLETAFFGGRHVSLAFTARHAMEKAVEANKCVLHAQALNGSDWAVLQVNMTDEQFLKAWKQGCLVCLSGCGGRPFLRFYDKMHLTMYRGKWQKGNLEALGLERWADLALTPKYWVNTCGSCSGCPSTTGVPTWRSQNRANEYCARCWWQFLGDGTGHGNTP